MSELLYDGDETIETKHWAGMPVDELAEWIDARHVHAKAGHNQGAISVKEPDEMVELEAFGFPAWVRKTFNHVERSKEDMYWSGYWDENSRAGAAGGWVQGFPHAHGWPHGTTIAMVVQAPEHGGESTIVLDNGTENGLEIPMLPMAGFGLVIKGTVKHGVKKVIGDTPRMVLIATVYGPEEK